MTSKQVLRELQQGLERLEAPDDSASQDTQNEYDALIALIRTTAKRLKGSKPRVASAADRLDAILDDIYSEAQLGPADVYSLLSSPRSTKLEDAENAQLRRLLVGYQPATLEELNAAFPAWTTPESISDFMLRLNVTGQELSHSEHMLASDRFLLDYDKQDSLRNALFAVLRNAESLRFAYAWEGRDTSFKENYVKDLAKAWKHDEWTQGSTKVREALLKSVRTLHGKHVTTRNRIMHLYKKFGPPVLLEPGWWICAAKSGFPSCTDTFGATVNLLLDKIPKASRPIDSRDAHIPEEVDEESMPQFRKPNNRTMLLNVVEKLGGTEALEYVKEFLAQYPDDVPGLDSDEE